jgi:hypothetical protein
VRGTRVTAEGAVLDRDAEGGGVVIDQARPVIAPLATRVGNRLALVNNGNAVVFDPNADLRAVAALPRVPLGIDILSFAAAPRETELGIVYTRVDPFAGNVTRVFFRVLSEPPPRRRALAR